MLSAFCDCYSLVKWQTLKSREFATSFVLTLSFKIYRTLIKAFYDGAMSRVQTLNGIHVSSHLCSSRGFECSGPPSLSQNGENVENKHRVGYKDVFDDDCNILGTSYST